MAEAVGKDCCDGALNERAAMPWRDCSLENMSPSRAGGEMFDRRSSAMRQDCRRQEFGQSDDWRQQLGRLAKELSSKKRYYSPKVQKPSAIHWTDDCLACLHILLAKQAGYRYMIS